MNRLVALMMCAVSLGAAAQTTISYPYNPDGNADSLIGASDIQDLLSNYGLPFSPSEIIVDGETLTTVLSQLQNSIDSLSGLTGGGGRAWDMPLGTVLPIATESVPEGWMLCDGREISIEEYQDLYDLIGTTYGAGDSAFWAQVFYPATTFNIPDLRGRTIIGANDMGGEISEILALHGGELGQTGGAEVHQLSLEESPQSELDVVLMEGSGWPKACNSCTGTSISSQTISNGGGDQPHNNMQPYMALNYMIKAQANDATQMMETEIIGFQADYQYDGTNPINGFFVPDSVDFLMPQPTDLNINRYVISRERKPITVIGLESFGILNDTLCYFELIEPLPNSSWDLDNNWQTKAHTLFPLFDNWFVK